MGGFTLKGVGYETELPQRTGIRGDDQHMGQPVITDQNIMYWGGGLVFPKSLKVSSLYGISLEVHCSEMRKGSECLVHMSGQPVVGKI